MSTIERTDLEAAMIRRRLNGRNVPPVRNMNAGTPGIGEGLPVTYKYGIVGDEWAAGYHPGEDYRCPIGTAAVAVAWGRIAYVGQYYPGGWSTKGLYGLHIIVRTPTLDVGYCHLSSARVQIGQTVRPGTLLGLTGATGNVSGPHLHFEARPNGGAYGDDIHPGFARNRDFRVAA